MKRLRTGFTRRKNACNDCDITHEPGYCNVEDDIKSAYLSGIVKPTPGLYSDPNTNYILNAKQIAINNIKPKMSKRAFMDESMIHPYPAVQMVKPMMYAKSHARSNMQKANKFAGPQRWINFGAGLASHHQGELKVCDVGPGVGAGGGSYIAIGNASTISTVVDNTTAAAAHQIAVCNSMAQGTDFTGRVGRKIVNKSLYLQYELLPISTTSSFGDIIRVMVFWDLQSNGATTFTLANLLLDQSAVGTTNTTSPNNLQYRDRFKIIYDKRHIFQGGVYAAGVLTQGSPHPVSVKKFIKLRDVPTTFNDTGSGVYGDIQAGALIFLFFSEEGGAVKMNYTTRLRFVDA